LMCLAVDGDIEGIAQAAAAALLFELLVGDFAGDGFQRDRARLVQRHRRVFGEFLPGKGKTGRRREGKKQGESCKADRNRASRPVHVCFTPSFRCLMKAQIGLERQLKRDYIVVIWIAEFISPALSSPRRGSPK